MAINGFKTTKWTDTDVFGFQFLKCIRIPGAQNSMYSILQRSHCQPNKFPTVQLMPLPMGPASPKSGGHESWSSGNVSQTKHFPMVYDMAMLSYIGMSYTVGKLIISSFQWAVGHDGVFVSMVAAPMPSYAKSWNHPSLLSVMLCLYTNFLSKFRRYGIWFLWFHWSTCARDSDMEAQCTKLTCQMTGFFYDFPAVSEHLAWKHIPIGWT